MVGAALTAEEAERLRAFERAGHDLLAASYQQFFSPVTALAIAALFDAVRLMKGMLLLDVATGPGSVAAAANRRGAFSIGIDLSPRMLELARSLNPGIEFFETDVERLPFPDNGFDAVVCGFGLGHFPRPEAAVAECLRVLRPARRVAFAWWDRPERQRIQGMFREAIAELGIAAPPEVPQQHSPLRFCDRDELQRLLEGAGLIDVAVDNHHTSHLVPDTETLWRGGLGSFVLTGTAIRNADPATQQAARAALERRAQAYKVEGGLRIPVAFNIASGTKPP